MTHRVFFSQFTRTAQPGVRCISALVESPRRNFWMKILGITRAYCSRVTTTRMLPDKSARDTSQRICRTLWSSIDGGPKSPIGTRRTSGFAVRCLSPEWIALAVVDTTSRSSGVATTSTVSKSASRFSTSSASARARVESVKPSLAGTKNTCVCLFIQRTFSR